MSQTIVVGISDLNIAAAPDMLISYALGSCVAICLFDSSTKIAGLSHIMLPSAADFGPKINPMKFADTAIVELVQRMEKKGAKRIKIVAKIAGGAQMFAKQNISDIGKRNVIITKEILQSLKIPLIAEDTGADYGRTVEFYAATGVLKVKSLSHGNNEI